MTQFHTVKPLIALVVDDHESSRYLIASLLGRSGFEVIDVATGQEAIDVVHTRPIDVAILDVNLADMTGFDVCEAIRGFAPTAWIPVVHVSATAVGADQRSEGLIRGADAYLVEPFEPRELLATVTALLRRANVRERTLQTAERLRSLNLASADVHAASNEPRVMASLVAGATAIAAAPASVLSIDGERGAVWRERAGQVEPVDVDRSAIRGALAPAVTGLVTVLVDDPRLVGRPHVGVCFNDEDGDPTGAIAVPVDTDDLHEEILPLLAQLALTATLALANIRALDIEHRIALTLQQSFLPQEPPVVDGLEVCFRYSAASQQAHVGGDFYEAFAIDDRHIAIAIGDVVGHSLKAATVMGEVRHAIRAYSLDGYDPRGVVERVERLLARFHPTMFTTAVYGVIDLDALTFTFCGAGHLPFVVVSAHDGVARLVTGTGALLGLGLPTPEQHTLQLAPGDRAILVTDGLIEVRTEALDDGLERLRTAAEDSADRTLSELVDHLLHAVGPGDAPEDDIAILALELAPADPHDRRSQRPLAEPAR